MHEFRLGFAFWGYTPYVFEKSEKVVWNDWDARMGKTESVEGRDLEGVAAGRESGLRLDLGERASHGAG